MKPLFHKIGSIGLFFFVYCIVRFLMWRGRLTVEGWDDLLRLVERSNGRCIIVSNHPTLWEPIFIKVLLWEWYRKDFRRHPQNVTAIDELDEYSLLARVLFAYAGLIPVDRDARTSSIRMFSGMAHSLRKHQPVITCPEGRCTATPKVRAFETDETYPMEPASRVPYMLMPQDAVLRFACREKIPLITVCVTLGKPLWFMSTSHWQELRNICACGMNIEVSSRFFFAGPETTPEELAHAILNPL